MPDVLSNALCVPSSDVPVPWPLAAHAGRQLCVYRAGGEAIPPPKMG